MPPFFDNPDDPHSSISLHGVPLEVQRDGRVFAPAEDAETLSAHGWRVSLNQDDGTGETPAAPTLAPSEHVVPPPAAAADQPPAGGDVDKTNDGVDKPEDSDQPTDDQQSDGTGETPAGDTKIDPATMDKAALRAFLAEHGQNPGPATGEEKLRAAVAAILAGGE
ncbi:hypothetical protein [Azospirillum sp. TSO5]|uniref:hypothetical protein n=1 Tax=Azospirillum sp. TSO5 TaxID=716760 RepID=UPI000D62125B|nr:hypothetical protein [Azospirillum sp. TSO5]PWC95455.1 hypothetical protein TSO5_10540 [Azospirillum sp. TSO5]